VDNEEATHQEIEIEEENDAEVGTSTIRLNQNISLKSVLWIRICVRIRTDPLSVGHRDKDPPILT